MQSVRATSKLVLRTSSALRPTSVRSFTSSVPAFIKAGDALPNINLKEDSPGNEVDLAKEIGNGKAVIVGAPGAFSPTCSESHVAGYLSSPKLSSAGKVFVVTVSDPFVTKAWGTSLDPSGASNIRFLADPTGAFTRALDMEFDSVSIFGNRRGKRYALKLDGGKIESVHVEPDNTGVDVSAAAKVLS